MLLLFATCGLVPILLFCFEFFFRFSFFSKNQKTGHYKNPKTKMQKRGHFSVSAVVFTDSLPIVFVWGGVGVGSKTCFAENTIKIVVLANFEKENGQKCQKG